MAETLMKNARARMRELHRAPETQLLGALLPLARPGAQERAHIVERATALIADLRDAQGSGWVNRFLQQYRLNTQEGIALLSLAEAFLRVPDADTADRLIRDKIGGADWGAHTGKSDSLLVNSATWGLVLTRAVVGESSGKDKAGRGSVLKNLIARSGEPFVRTAVGAAMRMMGQIFVMGRTIDEALDRADLPENRGFTASFDMLGEAARTYADGARYYRSYVDAIASTGAHDSSVFATSGGRIGHSISVKLSALHPRYETAHAGTCVPELTEMVIALAHQAASLGIGLTVDAEETERLDMSLDIIAAAARAPELRGWDGFGMAVQAYGKRAPAVIDWAQALGAETRRKLTVRLVKGAYWDSEIKRTQVEGLVDYPLFTRKSATDVSYLACARAMLASPNLYPAFATHNALTVATLAQWAGERRDFEFQRLHGMGEGLYERMVREAGYHCRSYAPVGGHRDLLAYLVRRLLENGANSSFVHQLADANVSDADLLADPAMKILSVGATPHPSIPLPAHLYGVERINSAGLDLADAPQLEAIVDAMTNIPMISAPHLSSPADVTKAVTAAHAAFPAWQAQAVEARAAVLERMADVLEANRDALMALCVDEAYKTIPDAISEVREAVDFCRYYAVRARQDFAPVTLPGPTGERNELRLAGRGVFAAIAPWNFPLAIFVGQVAAALVAGNAVVAKPAPQTPRIAAFAVELFTQAGLPRDVLHLVTGGGDIGHALVADARIMGVAFTGSTATARAIARTLLEDERRPLIPLIAETGGLNAMIVDSTALPEQVVVDVVTSAFRSAGQRCSALRLLLLQEDIADKTLEMLAGAMDALTVGPANDPRTDVGPVIDAAAQHKLESYRQSMRAHWLHSIAVPNGGNFVAPTVIRLAKIADMTSEWFGPILHVVTWKAGQLQAVIAEINATGYGLTMGLHSRIASTSERVQSLARVGNLYINRSMIGAVVGSQPFGGEGLSGTGFKAGGPHYLLRFATERTVSIDTTSAGGNASLLSIEDAATH